MAAFIFDVIITRANLTSFSIEKLMRVISNVLIDALLECF